MLRQPPNSVGSELRLARNAATDMYPQTFPNCKCVVRLVAITAIATDDVRETGDSRVRLLWMRANRPCELVADVGGSVLQKFVSPCVPYWGHSLEVFFLDERICLSHLFEPKGRYLSLLVFLSHSLVPLPISSVIISLLLTQSLSLSLSLSLHSSLPIHPLHRHLSFNGKI